MLLLLSQNKGDGTRRIRTSNDKIINGAGATTRTSTGKKRGGPGWISKDTAVGIYIGYQDQTVVTFLPGMVRIILGVVGGLVILLGPFWYTSPNFVSCIGLIPNTFDSSRQDPSTEPLFTARFGRRRSRGYMNLFERTV